MKGYRISIIDGRTLRVVWFPSIDGRSFEEAVERTKKYLRQNRETFDFPCIVSILSYDTDEMKTFVTTERGIK
jgi:hypothetical protein